MQLGRALLWSVLVLQISLGIAEADALFEVSAITVADGATEAVSLRSTERLPTASGTGRLERKGGTTEIEVVVDSMKPALLFGGDYNTYVLWVVPPGGRAENCGELALDGSHAKLHTSVAVPTFGILVTAEPHYLVEKPSAFVVLESKPVEVSRRIRQSLVEGVYNFDRSTLRNAKEARGEIRSDVRQAFTVIRLARRAGVTRLADAERSLDETVHLWRARRDRSEIAAQARETVRLAVAAQRLAQDRALQAP